MSYPKEIDAAIIYSVVGSTRTILCGIENVTINETANTSDRFRRDCEKPGAIPRRGVKVNGIQWDITGSGVANADTIATMQALLGAHHDYEVDAIQYDGTDAGLALGTFAGQAVMTAKNMNLQTGGDSTGEITLAGENDLIWTPAA